MFLLIVHHPNPGGQGFVNTTSAHVSRHFFNSYETSVYKLTILLYLHPMRGDRLANMSFLCRSRHFIQFLTKLLFVNHLLPHLLPS